MQTSWHWYQRERQRAAVSHGPPDARQPGCHDHCHGTIEPEEVIDVGAQVAGQIISFGQDPGRPETHDRLRLTGRARDRAGSDRRCAVCPRGRHRPCRPGRVRGRRAACGERTRCRCTPALHKAERDWERAQRLEVEATPFRRTEFDATQNAWETAKASVPAAEADLRKSEAGGRKIPRHARSRPRRISAIARSSRP